MTIPGIRTRWEMLVASRSRMEIWETEECRSSWCSGNERELAFCDGKTIRWVHSLIAASNFAKSVKQDPHIRNATYKRNDIGWLCRELMRKLFVVGNQMGNIYVAVILFHEHILSQLISALYTLV